MLRIFLGNLPHQIAEFDLRKWLEGHGYSVDHTIILRDRITGHSRGFGFAEVDGDSLEGVIAHLHGKPFRERPITVNGAHPRPARENQTA